MGVIACAFSARADDLNSRRAAFLRYYDTTVPNTNECCSGPHRVGRTGFWSAEGRFLTNDFSNGSNYMSYALADADNEGSDAGFSMWPAMDCYLRWNMLPLFTPSVTNLFEMQLTSNGSNYSSGATANQQMMFATTHYLAGTIWGTNAFPAGTDFRTAYGTADPSGKAFVSNTIASIPLYGLVEHDSLIYVQYTLGPIYTLEQFAPDPILRNKARMAFDWVVAAGAGYYFYDNWAVASDRTEPYWIQDNPTETTMMSYLFFGGPMPVTYLASYPSALYCMSNFPGILPEVMMAATNRAQSYTHCSTDVRNTGGYNNVYFKTSYVTPGYAVYSQAECAVTTNSDGSLLITNYGTISLSDPHQMQRWGVIWNAPNDQTKFWITNPYNPIYSGSYPNEYIGTTISEETVQLGGTLAAVYNIPTNATKADWNHGGIPMTNYQILEGQIPTNYSAVIDNSGSSGRLFLHYTNVLIALYISTNFLWVADTNLTNYFLIPANEAGLAIETASPSDYPQSTAAARLAAFRNDVLTLGNVNTNFLTGPNPSMVYTDRAGNTLQITFGQGAKTNGQSIDYQQWPAVCNPWIYQPQLGNLFIVGTNRTIIYNYNTWTETTNNMPALLTNAPVTALQNGFANIDLTTRISDAETPSNNLIFTVSNPTNGLVTLLPDGHTASFNPATNYIGTAGFNFITTDTGMDPRLVLYYNFQPPSTLASSFIADVSGNARSAGIITVGAGAAAYNPSAPANLSPLITQSLRLTQNNNGANAVALTRTVTTGNLSMTNGSWTFSTWFERAIETNDNFIFYMGSGNGFGGNGDELQLYCPANSNVIALSHWNTNNVQDIALTSTTTVATNQWHHAAIVFQHIADRTNNVSLYLDGTLVSTTSNVVWALEQNYPLVFGGHASKTSNTYRWFNGSLADLALFRGALNPGEIAGLVARSAGYCGGWTVTNAISINVVAPTNTPPILSLSLANNQVLLQAAGVNGDSGPNYTIQGSTNLVVWTNLFSTNSPPLPFTWADTNAHFFQQRFYRLLLGL